MIASSSNQIAISSSRPLFPDRPGFFVVMDRFKSFEPKMRRKLEYILENKIYEKGSEDVEEEAFEKCFGGGCEPVR